MALKKCSFLVGLGIIVLSLSGLWACSSGGGRATSSGGAGTSGATGTSGTSGTLTINMTDSPFLDAKAVLVTFSEVQVYHTSDGWLTVPFDGGSSSRTCDLKQLVGGVQDVLGVGSLPPGHYTQIRLVVTQSTLYFDDSVIGSPACSAGIPAPSGKNAPMEISSGEIKLNREFDLATGGTKTIKLDFDGDQSIHQTGNGRYSMNPVISIVSVQ